MQGEGIRGCLNEPTNLCLKEEFFVVTLYEAERLHRVRENHKDLHGRG